MRLEQTVSKALKRVNDDSYLLSLMVSKRANELSSGSETKLDIKKGKYKNTDIALMEIAQGLIQFDSIEEK